MIDAGDIVDAVGAIETCIDLSRYALTIGSLSSVVDICRRGREKRDYRRDYVRADAELSRFFGSNSRGGETREDTPYVSTDDCFASLRYFSIYLM